MTLCADHERACRAMGEMAEDLKKCDIEARRVAKLSSEAGENSSDALSMPMLSRHLDNGESFSAYTRRWSSRPLAFPCVSTVFGELASSYYETH